ncbi:MAG: DegT/DnrJ/EryC1/StrS aminotransferase family protein [Chloracidobacterium sp.]|nr:DegT/DnrJ/EryC1/StrS aminotransferase family protein [Chloracidobacterium sp.]
MSRRTREHAERSQERSLDVPTASTDHLIGYGAVSAVERKVAEYYGAKHALCVSSATAGLLALGLALDLKDTGFITSPLTYGASIASWLILGNRPTFNDVEPGTVTADPDAIRTEIRSSTRAILGIDFCGYPSDSAAIRRVADDCGLWYVSDSAQAFGARRDGGIAGSHAHAVVISLTSGKAWDCGEGGIIVTNNSDIYERLLWHCQHPLRQKRELGLGVFNEFAFNSRIHPLTAIAANGSFADAVAILENKQHRYLEACQILNKSGLVEPLTYHPDGILPSFFRFSVCAKEGTRSEDVEMCLAGAGIQARTTPFDTQLIYNNPVFVGQYGDRFDVPRPCREAERTDRRTLLTIDEREAYP